MRGIPSDVAPFFESLVSSGFAESLAAVGLVKTWRSDLELPGFRLVLEHERIPFWVVPTEWTQDMLADAAVMHCRLNDELLRRDTATVDFSMRNVMFRGVTPVFVDVGSIAPVAEVDPGVWLDDAIRYVVNPLFLLSVRSGSLGDVARGVMHRGMCAVTCRELGNLVRPGEIARYAALLVRFFGADRAAKYVDDVVGVGVVGRGTALLRKIRPASGRGGGSGPTGLRGLCEAVRRCVEALRAPLSASYWSEYYQYKDLPPTPDPGWTPKHHSMYRIFQELRPATVLDVGCNIGWFGRLAASLGSEVAGMDVDEPSLRSLYQRSRQASLPVTPVVGDFTAPWGPAARYDAWNRRLRAELVMATAVVHHLVFAKYMNLETIVEQLASAATRYLLIEFVELEDGAIRAWYSGQATRTYSLELLRRKMEQCFGPTEVYESYEHRRIVLARRGGS